MKEVASPVAAAVESARSTTTQLTGQSEQAAPAQAPEAVDPKLAAYEKKERQLRQMMKQVQAEKQNFEQQRQAREQEYQQNYLPKSRVAEDPLSVLSEAGITTEKLTELLLNAPNSNDPTIRALMNRISKMEEGQQKAQQAQEQAATAQYEQAKKQMGIEIKLLVDGKPDDFEMIREAGLQDAVFELIEETFNTKGYIMDVEDAASKVEAHLLEESLKFAKLKKVQSKLQPGPESPAKEATIPTKQPQTLTNSHTTSGPPRRLTDKERRARAIAVMTTGKAE